MDEKENFPNTVCAGKIYSVKEGKTIYLPYSEMYRGVRSNGMCAGNTPDEAIIEGLCELMERMAIKSIFTKQVVPPIIPKEYLKQFPSYAVIEDAESWGLKVEIRDCSLGKGLPVLGLLTINEKTGMYKYNFGSHPDFDYAIQRCLNEICQVSGGVGSVEEFLEGGMELTLIKDHVKHMENRSDEFDLLSRFYKALKNSNGELPYEYFCGKPSYEFQEWDAFLGNENYTQDIKTICDLLQKDGQQVFVRDVSFLGFPAYEVYITKYSIVQVDSNFNDYKDYLKNRRTSKNEIRMLSKLSKCSDDEKADLVDFLRLQTDSPKFFIQEAENNWMREVMGVPVKGDDIRCPQYVLALVEFLLNKYSEAYEHYIYAYRNGYLSNETEGYYEVLKSYLEMMADGLLEVEVESLLNRYFSESVVEKVLDDIHTEKLFEDTNILQYVDQKEMNSVVEIYGKVKPFIQGSNINMDDLKTYF